MDIFRGIQQLTRAPDHAVVTIGNFDGVHLGHRKILETAINQARARKGRAVAFTFKPHPQLALRPEAPVRLLSTYDERLELLSRCGIDVAVEQPFDRDFAQTPPERFFEGVILGAFSAEAVVVGYDFGFGKGRSGSLQMLEQLCRRSGTEFTVVPPLKIGEEVVSSSKIRAHLLAGEVQEAASLLGAPFSYRGPVLRGDQRGRKIGFPTANLVPGEKLVVPYGVYATRSVVRGPSAPSRPYPSVTNVGIRPTFQAAGATNPVLIETHLIGAELDLYDSTLEVQLVRKLRDEKRFLGIEELKAQIAADVGEALLALGGRPA